METSYIGMFIIAVSVTALIAHRSYLHGYKVGGSKERTRERALADRRVQGVLDYENKRKPKSRKNKLKASRKSRVGSISVCV